MRTLERQRVFLCQRYAPSGTAAFKLMPWPWPKPTDIDGIRAVMGSQFCSEWWQAGAPRSMKMGNIASLWRYDAGADHTLEPENMRPPAI